MENPLLFCDNPRCYAPRIVGGIYCKKHTPKASYQTAITPVGRSHRADMARELYIRGMHHLRTDHTTVVPTVVLLQEKRKFIARNALDDARVFFEVMNEQSKNKNNKKESSDGNG